MCANVCKLAEYPYLHRKYKDASLLSAEEFEEDSEGVLGSGLALGPLNTVHHHQDLAQADSLEEGTDSGPSQIRRQVKLYNSLLCCR